MVCLGGRDHSGPQDPTGAKAKEATLEGVLHARQMRCYEAPIQIFGLLLPRPRWRSGVVRGWRYRLRR